jgi:NAD(P)-dependent dehydrogenase (short-subunit alcohol dehydrogenase family)
LIGTDTPMVAPIFAKEGVKESIEALHPFRGIGQPEDIARAVVFLASEDNSWMTGVMMPVDGGYTAR